MQNQALFYFVFSCQVLLISFFLPRMVLKRMRYVLETYPPAAYPRLYSVSIESVERAHRIYRNLNGLALLVGVGLVAIGLYAPTEEMLGWDSSSVLAIYFFIQFVPLVVATSGGFTYFNPKRAADSRSTRKAGLNRRRLTDFVSPVTVGAAVFVQVAFVGFIAYVNQFDFPWFGGYLNVLIMTGMNVFFALLVARMLYGKKMDPYMANEDRVRQMALGVRSLFFVSIAATLFVSMEITMHALGLQGFSPVAMSLYFQLLAIVSFQEFRIDKVNFDVYKEEPLAT